MPSADSPNQASAIASSTAPLKPFSISLSTKAKSANAISKPSNSKKRPHSSLADDDSDCDDRPYEPQAVSAFDHAAGGAINFNGAEQKKEPLVIHSQKNQDWRAESYKKKARSLFPAYVQGVHAKQAAQDEPTIERNEVSNKFGLSFVTRDADGDLAMLETQEAGAEPRTRLEKPRDLDQEALEALTSEGARESTLVLQASNRYGESDGRTESINENEAFRLDVASRPDSASFDDYAAVPVEEFGSALLRGMGWKKGDVVGKRKDQIAKPRDAVRRPALLGIGAKEVPGSVEELGAWGKATKGKRKVDKTYNPVLLKNSVTGEMLTEEELEAKMENQKKEEQDWRERRDRNLARDEERKGQRRLREGHKSDPLDDWERDRKRSAQRSRHSSSRRERSRSGDRSRHASILQYESRSQLSSRQSSSRGDRSSSSERKRSKRSEYDERDDPEKSIRDRRQKDKHDRYGGYDEYDRRAKDRRGKDKYGRREDYGS